MASLQITEGFRKDLLAVESDRIFHHAMNVVELLQTVPTMGSRDLPASIKRSYGNNVRKAPVGSFDVMTLYDENANIVTVVGLVHQRTAW